MEKNHRNFGILSEEEYTNYLINPFVIMGVCLLMLGSSCKKDNNDDDNQNPAINITTVQIPAGTFIMGSPTSEFHHEDSETQHQVTLSAFRMSKYEITNAQYAEFLNAKIIGGDGIYAEGVYPADTLIYPSSGQTNWGLHYTEDQWVPVMGYEDHPVIMVTWHGASEFSTYAGGRLPTESEWEYACRAGTTTPFNTGNCLSNTEANYNWAFPYDTICTNIISTFPGKTQAVGSYPANAFGLHDMHGNVWEWCSDYYGTYPVTPQTNPTGPATGLHHVIRGASWLRSASACRSAHRSDSGSASFKLNNVGFRVAFVP